MWLWLCSIQLLAEFLATQFTSSVIHYQSVRSFTDFAHRTNCTSTKSTRLIFCTSVKTLMQISALCSWQNITLHIFLNLHFDLLTECDSHLEAALSWPGCKTWRRCRRKERRGAAWQSAQKTEPWFPPSHTYSSEHRAHSHNCKSHSEKHRKIEMKCL